MWRPSVNAPLYRHSCWTSRCSSEDARSSAPALSPQRASPLPAEVLEVFCMNAHTEDAGRILFLSEKKPVTDVSLTTDMEPRYETPISTFWHHWSFSHWCSNCILNAPPLVVYFHNTCSDNFSLKSTYCLKNCWKGTIENMLITICGPERRISYPMSHSLRQSWDYNSRFPVLQPGCCPLFSIHPGIFLKSRLYL